MWPIIWRESADADLAAIVDYIAQFSPDAAERMWRRIRDAVLPLAQFPYLHQSSEHVPGLREIVVRPAYIVLYRVTVNQVEIVAVKHSKQDWPWQATSI